MAIQTTIGGTLGSGLTWTATGITASNCNSMIAGDSVLVATGIANGSNLDQFMDISISLGSVTPGSGTPYVAFGLIPLNQDGSTYGNGAITTSASANGISGENLVASITAVPSTSGAVTGCTPPFQIKLPPGTFALAMYNGLGVTLASSSNVIEIRTYDNKIA